MSEEKGKRGRKSSEYRDDFMRAAQDHMRTNGSQDWGTVFEPFKAAGIPETTLWRWLRISKTANIPQTEIINAKARVMQAVKKVSRDDRSQAAHQDGTFKIAKHLPAAPSPNYIARNGERGMAQIDFVSEIHELYADAKKLRAFAVSVVQDADTGEDIEKIKNPVVFDKSIARRADLLETAIKAVQEVWDLRMMQNFYETIIEEIGHESPECQRRIMDRLAELNKQQGFTHYLKV